MAPRSSWFGPRPPLTTFTAWRRRSASSPAGGARHPCRRRGSWHGQARRYRGGQAAGRFRGGHRLHRECRYQSRRCDHHRWHVRSRLSGRDGTRPARGPPRARDLLDGPTSSAAWESGPTPTRRRRHPGPGRGAEGIGLARTEHMFMGERLSHRRRESSSPRPTDRERPLWPTWKPADRRLRGFARGDGRTARRDPAPRSSPPRVPAFPFRVGARDAAPGPGGPCPSTTCRRCRTRSRAGKRTIRCSACGASGSGSSSRTSTGCRSSRLDALSRRIQAGGNPTSRS